VRKLLYESLCNCHQSTSGADDDELFSEVLAHLSRDHPAMPFCEERIREFVTIRAYNLEYAAVYTMVWTKSSVLSLTELLRCSG
jgi:hypothetical protein